jgi:cell wall assembly regulator SMI1
LYSLQTVIETLAAKRAELGIAPAPPASAEAITAFEKAYQLTIPTDIKAFYQFCNGFETNDFLFRVLPLEEIVNELQEYDHGVVGSKFVFAEYMIYSDAWQILLTAKAVSGYQIINANHGTDKQVVLTDSIADFIIRYLIEGGVFGEHGLLTWYEEVAEM